MWTEYRTDEQISIKSMYSLFEEEYGHGFSFSGESHNFWECVYVKGGGMCVSADERVYNLAENELIFHKPMELHKFHINNSDGVKVLIFSFFAEGKQMDFFRNKVFRLLNSQKSIIDNMLDFIHTKIDDFEMPDKIRNSTEKYLYPFKISGTYSQMITTYILQLLLSLCEDSSISSASDTPDAVVFTNAVRFMRNNIDTQLSISEIASHCNISATGLKRIFSKYTGMGVHKYYTKLRIKTSAELLRDGDNVTDVAEKLGFGTQCYFSAVFKRETGISPTEFKRNDHALFDFM